MADARARALRTDARLNQDRLLAAAAVAFARDGAETSLKAIARQAGVGIATLYRRFPTREALIEAVYRNETERLCSAATEMVDDDPPDALRAWMNLFVDYMATKRGTAVALHAVLLAPTDVMRTRLLLAEAISVLMRAGVAADRLRADVDAFDVLMALGGITLIAGDADQHALAGRLLDLLMTGIRRPQGPSAPER